jgi:hypothetical protein
MIGLKCHNAARKAIEEIPAQLAKLERHDRR